MSRTITERVRPHIEAETTCPECDSELVIDGTETVCTGCGLIVDNEPVEHGPYWDGRDTNLFGEAVGRHAGPFVMATRSEPGSTIGYKDTGFGDRRLDRLRREHRRAAWPKRKLRTQVGYREIDRITTAAGLPERVGTGARQLFKDAHDSGLCIGLSLEGVATATLIAAGRIHNTPLTFDRAAHFSRASEHHIYTCYRVINKELALPTPPPEPHRYVAGIVEQIPLSPRTRSEAERLCKEYADDLAGSNPQGIAAGAIYIAAGQAYPQRIIAGAAGVCRATLRSAYQVMTDGEA